MPGNRIPERPAQGMAPDRQNVPMPDPTNWLIPGTIAAPEAAESSRDTEFTPARLLAAEALPLTPDQEEAPYTNYTIRTSIRHRTGIDSAPTARTLSTGQNAFWRKDGGSARLIVKWRAERVRMMPILPHWELQDPMYVLTFKRIDPHSPKLLSDGNTFVYSVSGKYVYEMRSPPGENYRFPVGVNRVFLVSPNEVTLTGFVNFSREPLAFLSGQAPPETGYTLNT